MAFLCPSRLGYSTRAKRSKGNETTPRGRITGSDSVDTIEQIGLDRRHYPTTGTKVEIIQDFNPKAPGEVQVAKGELTRLICTAKDWLYIEKTNGKTGYVPQSVCCTVTDIEIELSRTNSICSSSHCSEYSADLSHTDKESVISRNMSPLFKPTASKQRNASLFDVTPFYKTSHGQYIVLFDFLGLNENDVSVERAELVEVLNIEDPEWSWVRKYDGLEGFIPKTYICPVEPLRKLVRNGGFQRKIEVTYQSTFNKSLHSNEVVDQTKNKGVSRDTKTQSHDSAIIAQSDTVKDALQSNDRTAATQSTQSKQQSDPLMQPLLIQETYSLDTSDKQNEVHSSNEEIVPKSNHASHKCDPFQNVTEELATILRRRQEIIEHSLSDASSRKSVKSPTSESSGRSSQMLKNVKVTNLKFDSVSINKHRTTSNMVEYVMNYEYKGNNHGQQNVYVQKGEAIYADLNSQNSTEWIWVFIPRTNQYGYIPASYAKKQPTVVL